MIEAGKLNRRMTIWTSTATRNTVGEEVVAWQAVVTVWADRQNVSLRDVTRSAGIAEAAEARFVIRYRKDITALTEVSCEDRRYAVISTEELGNKEGLALVVRTTDGPTSPPSSTPDQTMMMLAAGMF